MSYPTHKRLIDLSKASVGDCFVTVGGMVLRVTNFADNGVRLACTANPISRFRLRSRALWNLDGTKGAASSYGLEELEALRIARSLS